MAKTPVISLARISVRGVVQGVGFRPFVYQLARRHNLRGWVCNTSGDVRIEVEGEAGDIKGFLRGLREQAPPLAHIESIAAAAGEPAGYRNFEIRRSIAEAGGYQLVSPDIATCPDCLKEVFDPADRRYRYPFTNCTNCGPRFTIIADIPYDRPSTTMKKFKMCPDCQKEYDDPFDRRFHAQPNACPVCGPRLELLDRRGKTVRCDDIITKTGDLLKQGKIVAVKGLGGFLLACDATSGAAVGLLRQRKHRPAKPLAVMVATLEEARRHCHINKAEADLLVSPASPIVLVQRRAGSTIAVDVAPGLDYLGIMLPYTPLHHLLLREAGRPLVMTSGNLSEEPIARDNDEARLRL
jgi:hydrogenase maturation protein HypF